MTGPGGATQHLGEVGNQYLCLRVKAKRIHDLGGGREHHVRIQLL